MRARVPLVAVIASLAAAAAPAEAQQPVDVGAGHDAHVIVDANGAAQIAYAENGSGGAADIAHHCLLPPSAGACSGGGTAFLYPDGPNEGIDSGVWPLLPGDGRVLVVDARCCAAYATKYVFTSTDGGQTFGPRVHVGSDNNSGANILGSALYAPPGALGRPAESVLTFGNLATIGLTFQATGTVGPPVTATPNNVLTQGNDTNGSLGLSGNTLVAAWTNITDLNVYWRMWSGTGDVNDATNWTPLATLAAANIDSGSRVASGPAGIYVAYNTGPGSAEQIVLRKFTGNGWAPPIPLSESGSPSWFDLVEDPNGVLHFVWEDSDGRLRYRFATSSANDVFTSPRTLLESNPNGQFLNVRMGVSAGGARWVTWEDSSPVHIRALQVTGSLPPPVQGKTANAVPVKGRVRVKLPAGEARARGIRAAAGFVPLEAVGEQIPIGSTLDTTKGTVKLTLAKNKSGGTQTGRLSGSRFVLGQRSKNPLTTLSMTGGGLSKCSGKVPRGGSPKAVADARKRRRSLFGNVRGRFRTRGRHSVATVRGTKYTVTDTCAATVTKVKSGTVVVRDLVRKRTRKLKRGQRYVARRGHG